MLLYNCFLLSWSVVLLLCINCLQARKLSESRVNAFMSSINRACQLKGAPYNDYSCKTVSWDDSDRGTNDGELSVWGASITDTRLWEKHGALLFTVRSDNWNEKLGKVRARDVRLIVGNQKPGGGTLTGITLEEFLKNTGKYASYAGFKPNERFWHPRTDDTVSIRFQTTFLPVDDKPKASLEFITEAYNYNTMSDDDPKNIVLLATSQGIAVQPDRAEAQKLFHHVVDSEGEIHRHWLEAERTKHKVGGSQKETDNEKINARRRGKATAKEIGIPAMGQRFNVLMTIQIPLKQAKPIDIGGFGGMGEDYEDDGDFNAGAAIPMMKQSKKSRKRGQSNAARVSIGSEQDIWEPRSFSKLVRHPKHHPTVTIVMYNTVAGGIPKSKDVYAAIDDMEKLYKACDWHGRLADKGANFAKTELTPQVMEQINAKLSSQPYSFTAQDG